METDAEGAPPYKFHKVREYAYTDQPDDAHCFFATRHAPTLSHAPVVVYNTLFTKFRLTKRKADRSDGVPREEHLVLHPAPWHANDREQHFYKEQRIAQATADDDDDDDDDDDAAVAAAAAAAADGTAAPGTPE